MLGSPSRGSRSSCAATPPSPACPSAWPIRTRCAATTPRPSRTRSAPAATMSRCGPDSSPSSPGRPPGRRGRRRASLGACRTCRASTATPCRSTCSRRTPSRTSSGRACPTTRCPSGSCATRYTKLLHAWSASSRAVPSATPKWRSTSDRRSSAARAPDPVSAAATIFSSSSARLSNWSRTVRRCSGVNTWRAQATASRPRFCPLVRRSAHSRCGGARRRQSVRARRWARVRPVSTGLTEPTVGKIA